MLAFSPAGVTGACTTEMRTLRGRSAFEGVSATVYGISIGTPFTLDESPAVGTTGTSTR